MHGVGFRGGQTGEAAYKAQRSHLFQQQGRRPAALEADYARIDAHRERRANYLLYLTAASCTYPKCSGTVFVRSAPPLERPNHTLVGECSVGGRRHTYTVDFNGIGFPRQFDWREPDKRKA